MRRGGASGEMSFGETSIVSTLRRKAIRFLPGSLDVEAMPISLLHGSSFDNVLAATGAESLSVRATNAGVSWAANKLVGTTVGKDVQKLLRGGLITGFRFGYIAEPDNIDQSKVTLNGIEFDLETIREAAILCDIRLTSDGSGGQGKVARRMRGFL